MPELRLRGLDAWAEGRELRRGVEVHFGEDELTVSDWTIPIETLFWTSRRAGLLMLFGEGETLALKGDREKLGQLARVLEGHGDGGGSRLPAEISREGAVFTAGVAAMGRIEKQRVRGLRVAAVTPRALHLLGESSHLRLPWPAEEARAVQVEGGGRTARALVLVRGEDRLRLLYLFPEEVRAALRLARPRPDASGEGEPEAVRGSAAGGGTMGGGGTTAGSGSLELFTRGEVAPPVRAELPVLHLAVDALQDASREAAARLEGKEARTAELDAGFFETHFLEIGEIALGPLLLRKSAAASAPRLDRAVGAMDAGDLQEDTRAAVARAAERLHEVYRRELGRLVSARRAPARVRDEHRLDEQASEEIGLRLQAPFEKMAPLLRELEERQRELLEEIHRLEEGPPDAQESEVEEELEAWKRALQRVDRAFEAAWHGMVGQLLDVWEERFLPALAAVGGMERRRVPEWVVLAALALGVVLAVATGAVILIW